MPTSPLPPPPPAAVKASLADLVADLADDADDGTGGCPSCGVAPDAKHRWGCDLHGSQQLPPSTTMGVKSSLQGPRISPDTPKGETLDDTVAYHRDHGEELSCNWQCTDLKRMMVNHGAKYTYIFEGGGWEVIKG